MLGVVGSAVRARPGLGESQRVALLAAASAGGRRRRRRGLASRLRVDRDARSAAGRLVTAAVVTAPQEAIARAADRVVASRAAAVTASAGSATVAGAVPGDRPGLPTQEQEAMRRRVVLGADAALVIAGVLVQRAATHGLRPGAGQATLRSLGRQVAVGGLAGLLVVGTDEALGESGRRQLAAGGSGALAVAGLVAAAQGAVLRRAARTVTVPTPPRAAWDVPLVGVPGVAALRVPVSGGGSVALTAIGR